MAGEEEEGVRVKEGGEEKHNSFRRGICKRMGCTCQAKRGLAAGPQTLVPATHG